MTDNVIGRDLTREIKIELNSCDLVVTDENVARLYPELCRGAFVIPAGERNKNPQTLFNIIDGMKNAGLDRKSRVAAVGGGVVGDITGLAAALYMRGIAWISVPTTLLAMTDSGIGGKTAVDFGGVKNLVGAFHASEKTVISTHFLKTLDDREWLCGVGEVIKTCLLDRDAYKLFNAEKDALINRSGDVYALVETCARIKSDVVKKDPTELGLRKILNVGHTVGHAIESADGYKRSHGEYVIIGMILETEMNKADVDRRFYDEIMPTLRSLVDLPDHTGERVAGFALSDKKNSHGKISVMSVLEPGKIVETKYDKDEFVERYTVAKEVLS